jgi:hypothetical protein
VEFFPAHHQLVLENVAAKARPVSRARVAEGVACTALAWGAFAFGGVYAWAYWPLAMICAAAGITGLYARGRFELPSRGDRLAAVLAVVAAVALLQLLPFPSSFLASLSPRRAALLNQLDVNVALGIATAHGLSIDPGSTGRAVILYTSFGLLLLGMARCSTRGALRLAWFISWLGIGLALTGIIQKPLYAGKVYGVWTPITHGTPFGPFVNRNHFAGWTLMAIPLALGYFCAVVSRGRATVRPTARDWVIWLASREASQALQAGFAVLLMSLALAITLSRSGMLSLALTLIVCAYAAIRRHHESVGRSVLFGAVALSLFLFVLWAGADTILTRFAAADTANLGGRIPIWRASVRILQDFWLVGSGLNTYGVATLFYPVVVSGYHLGEAHNDYLQLAIEGGALMGIPIVIAAGTFALMVRRRFKAAEGSAYWIRLGAVGGIVAIAVQSVAEFSLQMPGNAALFATLCAIALHQDRAHRN